MDDGHTDDYTEEFDPFAGADLEEDEPMATSPESDPWPGAGARRSPRSPSEGVRIIGAEEAAAAIESGQAARRNPGDAPRFGDVPQPPPGPRPPLRFPGADPIAVTKPPVATPQHRPERRDSYVEDSFWDEPADAPGEPATTWSTPEDWPRVPRGTVEGDVQAPSSSSERVGAGMSSGPGAERFGIASGDAGAGSEPRSDFPPRSSFDPGAPREGSGDVGAGFEDHRYPGLPQEGEEYEYEPFFAAPAGPVDQPASGSHPLGGDSPSGGQPAGPERPDRAGGTGPTLPHWTEPPSGEVPRIRPDAEPEEDSDDDLKAWSTLSTGPRWRDQPTDWEEADFGGASVLDDPEMRLGALRTEYPDEDEAFGIEASGTMAPGAPPQDRWARAVAPVPPGPPAPPGPPPAGRRPRRPDPGVRGGPGTGRRREGPRSGGPDRSVPRQPMGGGGGLSQMGGHELQVRVVTGAIVLAVLLVAAKLGPGPLAFVVAVVLTMAAAELYQAVRTHGYHPATLLGLAATAAIVGVSYWRPADLESYLLVAVLLVMFCFFWFLAGVSRARPVANIGVTLFGFMYIGVLGSYASWILGFGENGIGVILGAVLATAAYDSGAYFVGAWTGRTPLMPQISPGKTVEGLVGGTFAALAMCIILVRLIFPWDGGKAFWLFVVVSVMAPLGDLCESMIKRELGVKDMGAVIPGHGGVLDRIDALLFVIPATYYMLRVIS